ncbi:hypothetical protein C4553_00220 [Candidatus Parcubacteria bacterium]|nr:MAG: hypothetical protein C4553_00220 [Candidatus Parcubacteria bacterium]
MAPARQLPLVIWRLGIWESITLSTHGRFEVGMKIEEFNSSSATVADEVKEVSSASAKIRWNAVDLLVLPVRLFIANVLQ